MLNRASMLEPASSCLTIKHAFGYNTVAYDSLLSYSYHDASLSVGDDNEEKNASRLIYSVGRNICFHDKNSGEKSFCFGKPSIVQSIKHFTLCNNNRYVSVCESLRNDELHDAGIEDSKEFASIGIYNLLTMVRYKSLLHKSSGEFVCSSFCSDSHILASLLITCAASHTATPLVTTDSLAHQIVLWAWESERVIREINLDEPASLLRACPSTFPSLSALLTVSGPGVLKSWNIPSSTSASKDASIQPGKGSSLKPRSLLVPSKEAEHFLCHAWLRQPHAANGDKDAERRYTMVALSSGPSIMPASSTHNDSHSENAFDLKPQTVYVFEGTVAATTNMVQQPSLDLRQMISLRSSNLPRMESLATTETSFLLLGAAGTIIMYERTSNNARLSDTHAHAEPFVESRKVAVGGCESVAGAVQVWSDSAHTQRQLCVLTRNNRLLLAPLTDLAMDHEAALLTPPAEAAEVLKARVTEGVKTTAAFTEISEGGSHSAAVRDASVGIGAHGSRALLITVSADRTARMWDYENLRCYFVHYFGTNDDPFSSDCADGIGSEIAVDDNDEDPFGITLHPLGMHVLISFRDCIRLYRILVDQLSVCRELACRRCPRAGVRYSSGGHLFAAVSHNNILVYDSVTFEVITVLRGHLMAIRHIAWAPSDAALLSVGQEGCVYAWPTGREGRVDIVSTGGRSQTGAVYTVIADCTHTLFRSATASHSHGHSHSRDQADSHGADVSQCSAVLSTGNGSIRSVPWSLDAGIGSVPPSALGVGRGSFVMPANTSSGSDTGSVYVTSLLLSTDRQFLFAGTSAGSVRVYRWPPATGSDALSGPTGDSGVQEVLVHCGAVVCLFECQFRRDHGLPILLSAGEDGCVFVVTFNRALLPRQATKTLQREESVMGSTLNGPSPGLVSGHSPNRSRADLLYGGESTEIPCADVALVAVDDMAVQAGEVMSLRAELASARLAVDFETRRLSTEYAERVMALTEHHEAALAQEQGRLENARAELDRRNVLLQRRLDIEQNQHSKVIRTELENRYEHALEKQFEKLDVASDKARQQVTSFEAKLRAERDEWERRMQMHREAAGATERRLQMELHRLQQERQADLQFHEDVLHRQEDESAQKCESLVKKYEQELDVERDAVDKLKQIVKSKNIKLEQMKLKMMDMQLLTRQHASLLETEQQEKAVLVEAVSQGRSRLQEVENSLFESDKQLVILQRDNRTLEGFKAVLTHELDQLKAERGPLEQHTSELKTHIANVYSELAEEFELRGVERSSTEQLQRRVHDLTAELSRSRAEERVRDQQLQSLIRDLAALATAVSSSPRALEEGFTRLYKKHVKGELAATANVTGGSVFTSPQLLQSCNNGDPASPAAAVPESLVQAAAEADRQKQHLERVLEAHRRQLAQRSKDSQALLKRKLAENSKLLATNGELQKQVDELTASLSGVKAELSESKLKLKIRARETSQTCDSDEESQSFNPSAQVRVSYERQQYVSGTLLPVKALAEITEQRQINATVTSRPPNDSLTLSVGRRHELELLQLREERVMLLTQLEDSMREREMQRWEIARVRRLLVQVNGSDNCCNDHDIDISRVHPQPEFQKVVGGTSAIKDNIKGTKAICAVAGTTCHATSLPQQPQLRAGDGLQLLVSKSKLSKKGPA